MHPAPKVMADRTGKKTAKYILNIIGAPMPPALLLMALRKQVYLSKKPTVRVRLTYFQANRL